MVRKVFRYKLVSVYFIVSQLIVFTAIFGVLQIYNKAFAKENDRLNSIAANRIELDISTTGETNLFTKVGEGVSIGNVIAEGKILTEFMEAGSATRCEVLLAINEELPYPMISGHVPGMAEADAGKNVVALGRDKYKYAYERDGKRYVTLDQDEYEVVGVIGSDNSDYWDYKIVMNNHCISENTVKKISSFQEQIITIYSNSNELTEAYEILYQQIKNVDQMCNIVSYKKNSTGDSTMSKTLGKENIKVNIMVYIFCLLNCVIISMLWIIQRRKELAIKKTFGYGNVRTLLEIAGNIIAMMLISFLIFISVYGVYRIFQRDGTGLIIAWNQFSIISVVVLFLVTTAITMIYPICKICYKDSAGLVGGRF